MHLPKLAICEVIGHPERVVMQLTGHKTTLGFGALQHRQRWGLEDAAQLLDDAARGSPME